MNFQSVGLLVLETLDVGSSELSKWEIQSYENNLSDAFFVKVNGQIKIISVTSQKPFKTWKIIFALEK